MLMASFGMESSYVIMSVMSKILKAKKVKAVLFDLGKVLLHFNFDPAFKRLSKTCGLQVKDIEDYFVSAGLEVLYDGGKISSRQFYSEIKKALGAKKLGFEQFKKIWNEIFTPKKDMIGLVGKLSKNYRLVLISNTNAMHFEYIYKKYGVLQKFDRLILSYKEKVRKPDEKIYRKAAAACRALPHEIYYIDDRADLTEAAKELGFHTFTYQNNFKELVADMRKKGMAL